MVSFSREDVAVGRVISEDEGFMLLEITKDETRELQLDVAPENNRFFTILFVQFKEGDPHPTFKKPWEV